GEYCGTVRIGKGGVMYTTLGCSFKQTNVSKATRKTIISSIILLSINLQTLLCKPLFYITLECAKIFTKFSTATTDPLAQEQKGKCVNLALGVFHDVSKVLYTSRRAKHCHVLCRDS